MMFLELPSNPREGNMATLILLWALTGGGVVSALTMRFLRPDPPPIPWIIILHITGIVGGIIGGYIVHPGLLLVGPMPSVILPALIAAGGGGAILASFVGFITAKRG